MHLKAIGAMVLLLAGVAHADVATETRVREYFADAPVMIEIARCESKFRQLTDSGNPFYGGAGGAMVGVFQIHTGVHESYAKSVLGYDIETLEGNLGYAKYLYQTEGTDPWLSSAHCWEGSVPSSPATSTASATPQAIIANPNPLAGMPAEIQQLKSPLSMTLTLGMENEEVRTLQKFLNGSGYIIATEGPGSPGQETNRFGTLTLAAVRKFQCDKKIVCAGDDSYGVFGPRTRAELLATPQTFAGPTINFAATSSTPFSESEKTEIERLQKQIAELTLVLTRLLAQKGN